MINTVHRRKRQRDAGDIVGFTLIELLIVIVVLGILAAVVIFALGGITGKSAQASCAADGATVSTAMNAFLTENAALAPTGGSASNMITGSASGVPFIQSWPNNMPHYAFQMGTNPTSGAAGTFGMHGSLYIVTGAIVASGTTPATYVYTAAGGDIGKLNATELGQAVVGGNTAAAPALIPYAGPRVCSAATTAVS